VRSLQAIVQMMLKSLPDMGNVVLLLVIVMFIFSVVGIDLFSETVPKHFADIPTCFFTLFVAITQDGWLDIYRDMAVRAAVLKAAAGRAGGGLTCACGRACCRRPGSAPWPRCTLGCSL
jgi:hypothetical protein